MLKVKASKPKIKPPIEISDDEFSSTSSTCSSLSSLCPSRIDKEVEEVDKPSPAYIRNQRKRSYPLSSPKKDSQNLKRNLAKMRSSKASLYFPPPSLKQFLQKALENLTQAYLRLEGESKEQVKYIKDNVQRIIVGENPSIKETEKEKQETDILKGLVEEVRALRKEVAPKTYTEKLKKGLSSSTYSSSSSSPPSSTTSSSSSLPPTSPFTPTSITTSRNTNSTSPTSTRGKKKQLQERGLVLVTDQKDQPLDIFSIRNTINQRF